MGMLRICLWWIATALSTWATAGEVWMGPWLALDGSGSAEIGAAAIHPLTGPPVAELTIAGTARPAVRSDEAWAGGRRTVLRWRIAERELPAAALSIEGTARDLPPWGPQVSVRVAVVAGLRWPDAAELAALTPSLGGEVQAVLVLDDPRGRIGAGGWEARLPILLRPAQRGIHRLGSLAIAGPGGPPPIDGVWTVAAVGPGFDPSMLAPSAAADPAHLHPIIDAIDDLGIPLVFMPSHGATVVTDPMRGGGGLRSTVGGTRAVVVGGGAATPWCLPWPVARWWAGPCIAGLRADGNELSLVVADLAGTPATAWTWSHAETSNGHGSATAAGIGNGRGSATAATPADWVSATPAQIAALLDLPGPVLASLHLSTVDSAGLPARAATDPQAAVLAGRILTDPTALPDGPISLPPALLREHVLRDLAPGALGRIADWSEAVAAGDDAVLVDALRHLAPERLDALHALIAVAQRMADGKRPLPADPLVQLRLVGAIFDSPFVSPTPLRPLALALRERLDPAARGPLDRFTARHGVYRPADPPRR